MQDGSRYLELLSSARQMNPFEPLSDRKAVCVHKGEEVCYSYGAHAEDTLLAEYGFVLGAAHNSDDSVDVTSLVEPLFLGSDEGKEKAELLKTKDYWG